MCILDSTNEILVQRILIDLFEKRQFIRCDGMCAYSQSVHQSVNKHRWYDMCSESC